MRSPRGICTGVVVALALLAAGPASAAGTEPLRGQWHLDESCGGPCSTFADSSGNGLTGNGTGSPVHVSDGKFAGAQAFPTKSESVSVPSSALLQPPTVTLLAWVRAGSTPATVKAVAAQGASGNCGHSSYALYTGGSLDAAGLRFYIWNGTSAVVSPAADNAMWDGNWHLAAGTYDGATVRLYVDGNEVGSGTPTSGSITYGLAGNDNFAIGNYSGAAECIEDTNFSGDIDEVRVYSRALTATEIGRLAASNGPTPPDLVPDSAPAPQPPVARFSVAPNPTCVGSNTVLDASASTPGDGGPITKYEYVEDGTPIAGGGAVRTVVFPWSAQQFDPTRPHPISLLGNRVSVEPWIRTPATVTLTVTDSAGRQGSVTQTVDFLQTKSSDPRTGCPPVAQAEQSKTPETGLGGAVSSTVLVTSILKSFYQVLLGCNASSTCHGDSVVVGPRITDLEKKMNADAQDSKAAAEQARDRRKAAQDAIQRFLEIISQTNGCVRANCKPIGGSLKKRRKAHLELIGQTAYAIPARAHRRVHVRLTRSAVRFLRKWKWLNVGVGVVEVRPNGKLRVKTKVVRLTARPRKK